MAASAAVWTTFTAETGLPGDDVIAIDTNPDGTTWAMIALDRVPTISVGQRVLEEFPGRLGLAVFDGTAWKTVDPPVELEGLVELAAGPHGTAWLVGGTWLPRALDLQPSMGTQGLWFFDGAEWTTHFEGRPDPGEVRPVGAEVGLDGVLWSTGFKADGSGSALLRFDGDNWTTVELPERFRGVFNPGATVYHVDASGDPLSCMTSAHRSGGASFR